jgi:hypothetical protein
MKNLVMLMFVLVGTQISQSAHAATCREVVQNNNSNDEMTYAEHGHTLTLNTVIGEFFEEPVTLRDGEGNKTVYHGLKLRFPGGQGSPSYMRNGEVEVLVEQDQDEDMKGEGIIFYPNTTETDGIIFFCPGVNYFR